MSLQLARKTKFLSTQISFSFQVKKNYTTVMNIEKNQDEYIYIYI